MSYENGRFRYEKVPVHRQQQPVKPDAVIKGHDGHGEEDDLLLHLHLRLRNLYLCLLRMGNSSEAVAGIDKINKNYNQSIIFFNKSIWKKVGKGEVP